MKILLIALFWLFIPVFVIAQDTLPAPKYTIRVGWPIIYKPDWLPENFFRDSLLPVFLVNDTLNWQDLNSWKNKDSIQIQLQIFLQKQDKNPYLHIEYVANEQSLWKAYWESQGKTAPPYVDEEKEIFLNPRPMLEEVLAVRTQWLEDMAKSVLKKLKIKNKRGNVVTSYISPKPTNEYILVRVRRLSLRY